MQKRRKKKKSHVKLIVFIVFVLLFGLYLWNKILPKYTLVATSTNVHYSGIGQKSISGKDGYSTTFTTINGKIYKEYKQNGDSSWAERYYWGGTMAENGCGITCLATLASGYGMDYTPEDLRKKYAPTKKDHLAGNLISSELQNSFSIDNSDFRYTDIYFEKDYIFNWLKEDKPILICVWDKPNSKWTTSSHYMLLLATDNISKVYVSNPNGDIGSPRMSRMVRIYRCASLYCKSSFY